jgi:putative endonuclease
MNPALPNWSYVYMLESKRNGSIYVGCTSNLEKRMKEHKNGKVYSTRDLLPVELIYVEAYKSKEDVFEREKRLKHHGGALDT